MACTRVGVLLLLSALAACSAAPPALKRSGTLPVGATIALKVARGNISAYAPERGQPASQYTLEGYGRYARADTNIRMRGRGLAVTTAGFGTDFLVRGPKGALLDLYTAQGSINVADFDGVVNAQTRQGDIKMLLPQYGNARAGTGNVSVIFASTSWPGTLHLTADHGDVEIYVNENAAAHIHLRTMHGTIFTDFPLRGSASGASETIDGSINGGAKRGIEVYVRDGSIRLLQLKPQV
jgi:hypothetical protein